MTLFTISPSDQIYNPPSAAPDGNGRWWQTAVIYQIYPRSFQDSNGDGVGDLQGIRQRLPYLQELGIDALWISPFFRSPMADFGYDVSDYTAIDPLFGTMEDFEALLARAHELDIRLIIDFVPNHTSAQHPWFLASRSSRDNPKREWYIWRDPRPDGSPPTNLVGFFRGSAWTLDEATGQYYLHMFLEEQPDLNWRNPEVVAAMQDVLHFWLQKGVDGFRLDAITVLAKNEILSDLPAAALAATGHELLFHLAEIHNQPALHPILRGFRQIVDGYEQEPVLIGETTTVDFDELLDFYGAEGDEIHLPQNLRTLHIPWDAQAMRRSLAAYYATLPPAFTPSLVFGNHDQSRLATRYGAENVRAALALLLTLWGVPTLYYGDELGMVDGRILPEERQDPFAGEGAQVGSGRDPQRTPMQWDQSENAGFTGPDVTPWLPIRTTFAGSVATQAANPASTLNYCRRLLALRRRSPALQRGSLRFAECPHDELLLYERQAGKERMVVIVNFGGGQHTVDLSPLAGSVELLLSSSNRPVQTVTGAQVTVGPHEALIVEVGQP